MSVLKQGHPAAEGMSDYLLVEPSSLEDLKAPLRGSARLKVMPKAVRIFHLLYDY